MSTSHPLGGTRQSSPLADEMTYPLTNDEYLTIQDNLVFDKLTNWESVLISTFLATSISGIVIFLTGSFTETIVENELEKEVVNITHIITLVIYGALTLGTLVGFLISFYSKKKSKKAIERLNKKIQSHLNNL